MDECATNVHNCVEGSICVNTNGDFRCLCPGKNGMIDCTGMCKRRAVLIENGGWKIDNCINCTCLVSECRRERGRAAGRERERWRAIQTVSFFSLPRMGKDHAGELHVIAPTLVRYRHNVANVTEKVNTIILSY